LAESPHIDRVTLYGRNPAACHELQQSFPLIVRITDQLEDIWHDPSIEVVLIVLPHDLHAPLATAALNAGKHVICEKPAATSLAEFDRICVAAAQAGKRFLVVMNQLYNPLVELVRQLLGQGIVGRPFLSVENSYTRHGHNYTHPWRTMRQRAGGGVLIDGGFHMVYKHLTWLADFGRPQQVLAAAGQLNLNPDGLPDLRRGEDFFSATVDLGQSLRVQWSHAWTLSDDVANRRQCFIAGAAGSLELTDQADAPLVVHTEGKSDPRLAPRGPRTGPETTHACLLDYLEALATDSPPRFGTIELARQTLGLIEGIYASAAHGGWISF
jgi:predicted dehydrogenase